MLLRSKLLAMEAMKMQTTIYASADGTVDKISRKSARRWREQGFAGEVEGVNFTPNFADLFG